MRDHSKQVKLGRVYVGSETGVYTLFGDTFEYGKRVGGFTRRKRRDQETERVGLEKPRIFET